MFTYTYNSDIDNLNDFGYKNLIFFKDIKCIVLNREDEIKLEINNIEIEDLNLINKIKDIIK